MGVRHWALGIGLWALGDSFQARLRRSQMSLDNEFKIFVCAL